MLLLWTDMLVQKDLLIFFWVTCLAGLEIGWHILHPLLGINCVIDCVMGLLLWPVSINMANCSLNQRSQWV